MHCVKVGKLPSFSATYNCVSSAYCAWSIPNELITLATGDMYKVNNSGPRTEHWGIPYLQSALGDCSCPTCTNCVLPTTYDEIQFIAGRDIPKE